MLDILCFIYAVSLDFNGSNAGHLCNSLFAVSVSLTMEAFSSEVLLSGNIDLRRVNFCRFICKALLLGGQLI